MTIVGYSTTAQKLLTILPDQASVIIDASSPGTPVLRCIAPPSVIPKPVTFRAIFTQQAASSWVSPATFALPLPNVASLVQIYRNGLLQDEPGDYLISYAPGSLTITPQSTWSAGDVIRGIWIE